MFFITLYLSVHEHLLAMVTCLRPFGACNVFSILESLVGQDEKLLPLLSLPVLERSPSCWSDRERSAGCQEVHERGKGTELPRASAGSRGCTKDLGEIILPIRFQQ